MMKAAISNYGHLMEKYLNSVFWEEKLLILEEKERFNVLILMNMTQYTTLKLVYVQKKIMNVIMDLKEKKMELV